MLEAVHYSLEAHFITITDTGPIPESLNPVRHFNPHGEDL